MSHPSLNFFAYENELLANRQLTKSKHMKTEINSAPDIPASAHQQLGLSPTCPIRPTSPTQSRPVKPSQTKNG